jgi:hypothetical protein
LLGEGIHTCNPSIWAVEIGGRQVQGQPGLYIETLFQKPKRILENNVFKLDMEPETIVQSEIPSM